VVTNFIFRSATVSSILVTGWILPSNTKNTTQTGASSPPAVAPLDPVDRGTDTPSSRGVAWHRRSLQRSGSQHRASPKQYYTPRLFSMPALMASADPRSPSPTSGPDRVPTDCSRAARAASRRSGRPRPMVLPRGGAPATYRKPGGTRCPGVPEQGGSGSSSRAKRSPARATDGQQSLVACGGDRGQSPRVEGSGPGSRRPCAVRPRLQVRNLAQLDTATDCSTTGECLVCAVTTWATGDLADVLAATQSHGVDVRPETPPDGRVPARWLTSAISIGKLAVPLIVTATWSVGAAEPHGR
jgi:hypothetical protein